jgi:hypothetical protein
LILCLNPEAKGRLNGEAVEIIGAIGR